MKAKNLLDWYAKHGELSYKQQIFAGQINRQSRTVGAPEKEKHYYLYAIADGPNVKLGYASKPEARLRALQVGSPDRLVIAWTKLVGVNQDWAKKAERQLHRYCHAYHKRGEWFSKECLPMVLTFKLKGRIAEEEEAELEILTAAQARI